MVPEELSNVEVQRPATVVRGANVERVSFEEAPEIRGTSPAESFVRSLVVCFYDESHTVVDC